jgi:hypothetical protein
MCQLGLHRDPATEPADINGNVGGATMLLIWGPVTKKEQ